MYHGNNVDRGITARETSWEKGLGGPAVHTIPIILGAMPMPMPMPIIPGGGLENVDWAKKRVDCKHQSVSG